MMSDNAQEIQQDHKVHSKDAVSSEETREYVLIKSKYADIIEMLSAKRAAEVLSGKLYQAGMITVDMLNEAELSMVIQSKRIRPLVSAILAMVKTDKENYKTFITILRDTDGLSDIAAFIEDYSKSKDVFLPECVSGTIERYLPKCEEQWKVHVSYHEKERKLVVLGSSEEECSKVKEWIEQKIFPLVLQFHPDSSRFLQTPYTSVMLKKTPKRAPRTLAWFTAENLEIHSAVGEGEVNKDRDSTLKGKVYAGDYESIYKAMTKLLKKLEPYKHSLRVGYEARFGRVHWRFPSKQTNAGVYTLVDADKTFFEARMGENIQKLLEFTLPRKSTVNLLDPLKVTVTTDGTECEVVAVVDEQDDGRFTLNKVYHAQPGARLTCDIVFPYKRYDIRIAPNFAPVLEEEVDDKVLKIVVDMVESIKMTKKRGIKMRVRGDNYCVKFMRRKTQIQRTWKKRQEWILAEYHVQQIAINDKDTEKWKIGALQELDFEEMKTEIELWSQKWLPDSAEKSRFTRHHYCNLKSTAKVSLPFDDEIEASSWTASALMESFEDFVSTSVDIVDILSS